MKYEMYLDADGGTFYETKYGHDCFDSEMWISQGSTLVADGTNLEDPTCAGMKFLGWYGYNKDTGAQLENGKLFTTQEVVNYVMPAHAVEFKAQWSGTRITAITYAALYNVTGEVDYNVTVTLVNNGVTYSGKGFVTIPESVYTTWTGDVQTYWEFPGEYINANYQYIPDYFDGGKCTVSEFIKQKSCYQTMFKASGESEVLPKRSVVNDFFTFASGVMPDKSISSTTTAGTMISDTTIVPSNYTITTNQYESGATYDKALKEAQDKYGSSNVLVYNIDLKDDNGSAVHQLSGTVDVKMSVPSNFTVQAGNTVVVYYLNDNGALEECPTVYDDATKTVTFKTNHFSVYIIAEVAEVVEETEDETNVSENDTSDKNTTVEDESDTSVDEGDKATGTSNNQNGEKEPASAPWVSWVVFSIVIIAIVTVVIFVMQKKNKK